MKRKMIMSSSKKTTTVEVLEEGDTVFGHSNMAGKYWVREYRDGQETGGAFFSSKGDADKHIKEYLVEVEDYWNDHMDRNNARCNAMF